MVPQNAPRNTAIMSVFVNLYHLRTRDFVKLKPHVVVV